MNEEDKIWRKSLRSLATDVPEADAQLERRLLSAFQQERQQGKRVWFRAALAATGAIAAAVCVFAFLLRTSPLPRLDLPMAQAPKAPQLETQVNAPVVKPPEHNMKPRVVKAIRKPLAPRQAEPAATAFFALPYTDPSEPMLRGDVIRVSLPRSAMGMVGLPVNPERMFEPVQADVIVGDDGLAHAIRFVKYP